MWTSSVAMCEQAREERPTCEHIATDELHKHLPSPPVPPGYVCTYVCMYIRTYIHTYIGTYVHTYVHTYVRTYVHTYIHTYIRMYVCMYIHTYVRTYVRTYVCIYKCAARARKRDSANFLHFLRNSGDSWGFETVQTLCTKLRIGLALISRMERFASKPFDSLPPSPSCRFKAVQRRRLRFPRPARGEFSNFFGNQTFLD